MYRYTPEISEQPFASALRLYPLGNTDSDPFITRIRTIHGKCIQVLTGGEWFGDQILGRFAPGATYITREHTQLMCITKGQWDRILGEDDWFMGDDDATQVRVIEYIIV
jgi:hypothetical protein